MENKEQTTLRTAEEMKKISVQIPKEQKDFLELIIHQDAAANLSEAVQWCIDNCMRIENNYQEPDGHLDACYVAFRDVRKEGHPEFSNQIPLK